MKYEVWSHRFAEDIIKANQPLTSLWQEIIEVLADISDDAIINEFRDPPEFMPHRRRKDDKPAKRPKSKKSLSVALNNLIDDGLSARSWIPQSAIFQADEESDKAWRLDFSKKASETKGEVSGFAVEVAFNHGEAIAWNLMKPSIAAEINHVDVQTDIGVGIGVVITATENLKKAGDFDNAVGTYEKVKRYLNPMFQKLTVPIILVGLEAPESFHVKNHEIVIGKFEPKSRSR